MSNIKEKLINNDCIQVVKSISDWTEALHLVAKPLLEKGFINENYLRAIISETEKIGAYYVYDEELIALPHARPECGVLKNGISLLLIKNGVSIAGSNPVSIIMMFCATDATQHIESGITSIMELLEDEKKMDNIRKADSVSELIEVL